MNQESGVTAHQGDTTSKAGQLGDQPLQPQHLLFCYSSVSLTPLNICWYMTVQSGRNKLERFSALNMCKWETGLRSLPLLFCALRTVAALIIRPSVRAAPPPGLWQRKAFYFSNLPVSPLANLEAITSDSTMSYGPILLQEKHVGRNAASSECKVGETGISHNRQSWKERERRGKKETTKGNQDREKGQDQSTDQRKCGRVGTCRSVHLCMCADTPRHIWSSD